MLRLAATSCLFLILGLSSFQKPQIFTHGKVAKDMPRIGRKQAREVWLETLEMYANKQEWTQLGYIAKAAIEDGITINQILEVAQKTNQMPFLRAVVATQNMRTLPGKMGINKNELFRIALFVETDFEKMRHDLGTNYLSRRRTGLERTLEYFPETNMIFIHLKKHGVDEVGRGVKKVVTKSILYDVENPQLAARCASSYQMRNEMAALQHMQGSSGIVKLYACSEGVAKDGSPIYYMMCKLYEGGALSKAFKNKYKFSYKQKLNMTHDLLEGLHALHSKGLIHRDLTARNILLENTKKGSRKNRDIRAVIADFGRIKHVDSANGIKVQFNSSYLPPEGIIAEKLAGEDYYATDLFALGCILHRL
ncbi:MAG: protein kinase, partial [Chlamydiales bacterium]|nr:protein kinase [Chlamydiales bacterium]